jgi:hypothetical protein
MPVCEDTLIIRFDDEDFGGRQAGQQESWPGGLGALGGIGSWGVVWILHRILHWEEHGVCMKTNPRWNQTNCSAHGVSCGWTTHNAHQGVIWPGNAHCFRSETGM